MRTCVLISTVCLLAASALAGWIPLNSGTTTDLEDVCFPVDAVTGYAVGGGGLILKTTDGGATWDSLPGSHPGWQMAVHFPVDAVTGFAVASGGQDHQDDRWGRDVGERVCGRRPGPSLGLLPGRRRDRLCLRR